jgi:hypothetical protein
MHINIVKKSFIFIFAGILSHFSYAADMHNSVSLKRIAKAHSDRPAKSQKTEEDISGNIELVFNNFLIEIILATEEDLKYVLDLITVSKLFYEKITGFEYSEQSLWKLDRKHYCTVLNKRQVYSSELRLFSGQDAKKISDQCENYFVLGIKGRKLPRYIVEALSDLIIQTTVKKKNFAAEKTEGYLKIAKRLEKTGIKSLALFAPDASHVPGIIAFLNNLADSNLESIALLNVFLNRDHMRALEAAKNNQNLNEIGFGFFGGQAADDESIGNLVKYIKSLTHINSIIIYNSFADTLWRNVTSSFLDKIDTINSLEFRITPPHDQEFPKLLAKKEIKRLTWYWPKDVFVFNHSGFSEAVKEIAGYVDYIPTLQEICLAMEDYYYEIIGNLGSLFAGDVVAMKELVTMLEKSGRPIILRFTRPHASQKGYKGWVGFMSFISYNLPKNIILRDEIGHYTPS